MNVPRSPLGAVWHFIQFDTQFLAIQHKLRLDLVRAHFAEGKRRVLLREPDAIQEHGARGLRTCSPRSAVLGMVDDPNAEVFLVTPKLSRQAFDKEGVFRALKQQMAKNGNLDRIHVLVNRCPSPTGPEGEALLAWHLAGLVREGLDVRVATGLEGQPWRALCRRRGGVEAIGGLQVDEGKFVPFCGEDFGPSWLSQGVAVELAEGGDGPLLWSEFESRWASGTSVQVANLVPPDDKIRVVQIRQGATDLASTDLQSLLEGSLWPLGDLGQVEAMGYVDRYAMRSPVAMLRLKQLLDLFRFAPGAEAFVLSLGPSQDLSPSPSAENLLKHSRPSNLSEPQAMVLRTWIQGQLEGKVQIAYPLPDLHAGRRLFLRHPRKLLIRFAPGGRLSTLKVVFEHGLDWVRPVPGTGPWPQRDLVADETHIVILRNHRLEDEDDAYGQSEWSWYFDRPK